MLNFIAMKNITDVIAKPKYQAFDEKHDHKKDEHL